MTFYVLEPCHISIFICLKFFFRKHKSHFRASSKSQVFYCTLKRKLGKQNKQTNSSNKNGKLKENIKIKHSIDFFCEEEEEAVGKNV